VFVFLHLFPWNVEKVRQRHSRCSEDSQRKRPSGSRSHASYSSLPAALSVERRVLARLGWEAETAMLFKPSRFLEMFWLIGQA